MKLRDAIQRYPGQDYRPERCEKITEMLEYAQFIILIRRF